MEKNRVLDTLAALAHDIRLDVFRLLVQAGPEGRTAGEIADMLNIRANTLSNNLTVLAAAGLVHSAREGRSIRYFAGIEAMRGLLAFLMQDCCGGRPELCQPVLDQIARNGQRPAMTDHPYHVLFLCTGNSARSILAEAILNAEGKGRFHAHSAGSFPKGTVHPLALQLLERRGHDTAGLRSKGWDEFAGPEAPQMDFVFTVCDDAAGEICPVWPGQPMTAHWGLPDPAAATGTEAERHLAFAQTYRALKNRISAFVSLPIASLDRLSLQGHVDRIGRAPDAPAEG